MLNRPTEKELFLTNATRPLTPQYYLASPYTSPGQQAREDHVEASRQAGVALRRQGYLIYCPLLAGSHELDSGWYHYDLGHLRDCRGGLIILTLPGWEKSFGIQLELAAAIALERPVKLLDPEGVIDPKLLERIKLRNLPPEAVTVLADGTASVRSDSGEPVSTKWIASLFLAGRDLQEVAQSFGVGLSAVEDALRYELW